MEHGQPITRFSLTPHTEPYNQWNGKTQLLCDGQLTATWIDGCELKAQYQAGEYYVLITEYDNPFEEAVAVTLLDRDSKPLASSILPQIPYPTIGYPSYMFDKLAWHDARSFDLYIQDLSYHYRYTIRDFSIPVFYPRLAKRRMQNAS